jgi:hypothetical protein
MPKPEDREELVIDVDYLTGNEIMAFEELTDMPFDVIGDPTQKKGRALVALACIIKRRDDPGFTFEQAGELAIRLDSVPDPTGPAVPAG